MNKKSQTSKIAYIGLFAALVLVASKIEIRLPLVRFHLGNSLCILSGLILGPIAGGLGAGLGSFLYDIIFYTSGIFSFVTFFTKFILGFVCGLVFKKRYETLALSLSVVIAGISGEVAYIIVYLIKVYVDYAVGIKSSEDAMSVILLAKLGQSVVNAVIAIVTATPLYMAIRKTLKTEL